MTPKTDLFDLVHSLTDREAKAFKSEIMKRQGEHVYLKLFDIIRAQEQFDEEKIKSGFEGSKTINNFSIAKSNLYEKLLEVLCAMPQHQNIETDFDRFRQQISILVRKSLHKQAIVRVQKAMRIAEKLEANRKVLDLNDILREIARNFYPPEEYLKLHRSLRSQETWLKEVEQNLQLYRELFDSASIAHRVPEGMRMNMVSSILGHELMQDESECRSISAKLYFFRIWNHLYTVQGLDTGWKFFNTRIIQVLEENPHLLTDPGKLLIYINAITDFGLNSIAASEFAGAMESAGKLQMIRHDLKTGESEGLIFSRYWKLQLLYCQKRYDEKNGLAAVEHIKEGLKRYRGKLSKSEDMELRHIMSTFLLSVGRSSEALPWVLSLRDDKLESSQPELHIFSWILFLVAHYQLGHLDVVEQQLPSTIHFMREHRTYTTFMRLILGFFKKAVSVRNRSEELALLEKTRTELSTLLSTTGEERVLNLFDLVSWLQSRIAGVPMSKLPKG